MTIKQKILKLMYPFIMAMTKLMGAKNTVASSRGIIQPPTSVYDIKVVLNGGKRVLLSAYVGKKILFVNTASNCGYTAQLAELEHLQQKYKNTLAIIGFPSNDFKEQEKGSDQSIEEFCRVNYGVSFPIASKSVVVKSDSQNEVYKWLTSSDKNGWNNQLPEWNFSKYLVNEQGILTHYFGPSVSPMSDTVVNNL